MYPNEVVARPEGLKVPEGFQRRSFPLRELRVEAVDGKPRRIIGYAAMFDVLSEPLWGFREKIRKGAFSKTIQTADVRALFNHDENYVLGRSKAGTLKLWEDNTGLGIEIVVPDTQWARDLVVTMERGDVDQMSFSFRVVREDWSHTPDQEIRTLIEVELHDVSPVTFPAYTETIAQLRSVFGIKFPRLGNALRRLEAGTAMEADRRVLGQMVRDVERRLPGDLARRRRELKEAELPAGLVRMRRELELAESEVSGVEAADPGNARRRRQLNQLELDEEPASERSAARLEERRSTTELESLLERQSGLIAKGMAIVGRTFEGKRWIRYLSTEESAECDEIMAEAAGVGKKIERILSAAKRVEWEKIHGPSSLGIH
jgi:hypothetical protein